MSNDDQIYYEDVFVTPELAASLLGNMWENYRNETLSTTLKYARAMLNGEWMQNAENVKLWDERVWDGQHRLRAILAAKQMNPDFKGQVLTFAHNVPLPTVGTVDVGKTRTFPNIMKAMGLPYTKKDFSIAKAIEFHDTIPDFWNTRFHVPSLETYEAKTLIERYYPGIKLATKVGFKFPILTPIVEAYYYAPKKRPRLGELVRLAKLGRSSDPANSAALHMWNLNNSKRADGKNEKNEVLYQKAQSAVKAFLENRPITVLKPIRATVFPLMVDEHGNIVRRS